MASKKTISKSSASKSSKSGLDFATGSSSSQRGSLDGCEGGQEEAIRAGSGSAGGDDLPSNTAAPNVNFAGSNSDVSEPKPRQRSQ